MNQNKIFIPVSIIVAGLIIAGAVFLTQRSGGPSGHAVIENNEGEEVAVKPVTTDDHILGNPDADILIVEYSDFECPFCARFHPTMEQVLDEYGDSGKVAWVFRHFPLDQIHRRARPAANASECVADLGGNEAFWEWSARVFADQENSLSDDGLRAKAVEVGIDEGEYNQCVDDEKFADEVENDYQDGRIIAQNDSNFGTPYSIIISKSGVQTSIVGAQPFSVVKQIIDTILGGSAEPEAAE